jgi:hypothetical protein
VRVQWCSGVAGTQGEQGRKQRFFWGSNNEYVNLTSQNGDLTSKKCDLTSKQLT